MEAGMYALQPTIGEEKWQNQAEPHQVFQLVLSILHNNCQIPIKIIKHNLQVKAKPLLTQFQNNNNKSTPLSIPVFIDGSPWSIKTVL